MDVSSGTEGARSVELLKREVGWVRPSTAQRTPETASCQGLTIDEISISLFNVRVAHAPPATSPNPTDSQGSDSSFKCPQARCELDRTHGFQVQILSNVRW